jgi:hypothetical protein
MKRNTTEQEKAIFFYLNKVKGEFENIYDAKPYIEKKFGIKESEAKQLLLLWMKNFNEEGIYDEIIIPKYYRQL